LLQGYSKRKFVYIENNITKLIYILLGDSDLVQLISILNELVCGFTVFLQILTDATIPIIGTSNSSCHAGYCICVTTKGDSILDSASK
jgi:ABC-type uncharacterized transport system substrate-binding protein